MNDKSIQSSTGRPALISWSILTLLVIASLALIYLHWGAAGFDIFIFTGPYTHLGVTLTAVVLCWLILGTYLYLFEAKKINNSSLMAHIGFLLVAFTYLNAMRERNRYGDISYYIEAATDLLKGKHLPSSYFYPPLWATFLKYLVPYGEDFTLTVAWALNMLSLFLFYLLLRRVLMKYGFGANLASFVVTAFLLANATVFRTLGYVQVNLHVLNFIFGSILLFERNKSLSALCLAFAFHLKASPLILAFAFLLERDLKWLIWFGIHILWISGITLYTDGVSPFLDFYNNAIGMASMHEVSSYRDVSFDGIFTAFGQFNGFLSANWRILALASKLTLGLAALFVIFQSLGGKTERGARMLASMPVLLILMTMSSPIVWEHHGIFLALPFLILLPRLDSSIHWLLFIFAYFFEFILPAFDFLPWSYMRFIAPFIILWLLWRTKDHESAVFKSTDQWFTALSPSSAQ